MARTQTFSNFRPGFFSAIAGREKRPAATTTNHILITFGLQQGNYRLADASEYCTTAEDFGTGLWARGPLNKYTVPLAFRQIQYQGIILKAGWLPVEK